jgi:hypothetical protein
LAVRTAGAAGAAAVAATDAAADAGKAKASRNVKTPLQKEVLEASYQSKSCSAAGLQLSCKLHAARPVASRSVACRQKQQQLQPAWMHAEFIRSTFTSRGDATFSC